MKSKKTILIGAGVFLVIAVLCIGSAAATMTVLRGQIVYPYNPGPIKTIEPRTVIWPELPFMIPEQRLPLFKIMPMPPFFIIGKKPLWIFPLAEHIKITWDENSTGSWSYMKQLRSRQQITINADIHPIP